MAGKNGKTKVEELTERKATEGVALQDLESRHAAKLAAITELDALASRELAGVDLVNLEREAKKQAQASVEAAALRIEAAELSKRITLQRSAIEQTAADILAEDRAVVAAEGAALLDVLTVDIAQLSAKLAQLKELGNKHASLDARIARIAGYTGLRIANSQNFEELAGHVRSFEIAEHFRKKKQAELAHK